MTQISESSKKRATVFWLHFLLCAGVVALFVYLRLVVYPDRIFPLSSGLPLLLCLWNKNLRLLYGMAVFFTVTSIFKLYWTLPHSYRANSYDIVLLVSNFFNVWMVAFVIHRLLHTLKKVQRKGKDLRILNQQLESSNEELVASNEELAAREEEIFHQNEALQRQTEELEQQAESLRHQAEVMEQQSAELQEANHELIRRENGLQTLLNSSRWLHRDNSNTSGMSGICKAALEIMGESVHAADLCAEVNGEYIVWGEAGFGVHGMIKPDFSFYQSFASLAAESSQTVSIDDIATRKDLEIPVPRTGRPMKAVLATPVWHNGQVTAVLCLYSMVEKQWTQHAFSLAEWLSAQAALALQTIRFQQEIEVKRNDAERLATQKSRFLAAVSHDIRTPANAISLLAEMIDRCSADPVRTAQVPALAKNLWNNARSLVELVSDVLDLTRLDSGLTEMQITEFSLAEAIQSEVGKAAILAGQKGLSLEFQSLAEDYILSTDRIKLGRILSNLLSNAVKFTEKGSVQIYCERPGLGDLRIHVKDTGIGIPADSVDHIFDEFFQLRNPERDKEKGAGLGLAICQRLAASLDARITVQSIAGLGTTFTLTLPAKLLSIGLLPTVVLHDGTVFSESVFKDKTILVVEDNEVAGAALCDLLRAEGAQVDHARNGSEALRSIDAKSYEILLLDLNLPDMDGSAILVNFQTTGRKIPRILVVTGDARVERVEQVKKLGADGVLAKPINLTSLHRTLVDLDALPSGNA